MTSKGSILSVFESYFFPQNNFDFELTWLHFELEESVFMKLNL